MASDVVNQGLIVLNDHRDASIHDDRGDSTIIVTGVARGGTSMVAQSLKHLGLFMGDKFDPRVVEDTEIIETLQSRDMDQIDRIIADRNQRFEKWGFKVPNLYNFILPQDEMRFRNRRHVVVFRDTIAIARRNEISMRDDAAMAFREAGENVMRLTSYVCGLVGPALLCSYEKAVQNPEEYLERLIVFCGLTPSAEHRAAALAALSPDKMSYIFAAQSIYWGMIDGVNGNILRGWCSYQGSSVPLNIEIYSNGKMLGLFKSNDYREDLLVANVHDGRNAFNIDLSVFNLSPGSVISVHPAGEALSLPNSGLTIEELRRKEG